MEATSRGARAGGKEGKEGEEGTRWRRLDAHLDATTADVVPTRSPAAAATVAATVPTRGVVPFAVSMQDDIYIIYFFFLLVSIRSFRSNLIRRCVVTGCSPFP